MSGNTNTSNTNMTREELHDLVINEQERDEFGFQVFQSPYTQAPFERAQREYRLKYNLKQAYDKQEFLRKMRADIKREYLTRKKQLKKLQQDAAVMFREDEMKLQEHYSREFSKSQPRREIDIHAPLVSHVALPYDEYMNVKEFNIEQAFEGLRNLHREYYESDMEATIRQVREKQEREREQQQQQQQQQQQDPHEIPWAEWVAAGQVSETCLGCNDLECSDCYDDDDSDGNGNGNGNGNGDSDSYDSDYCDVFCHYPREYEWERQAREDEEARVAQAARLRAEHEAEAAAEDAAEEERRRRWHDMSPEEEQQLWFKNTRGVNDPWSEDDENDDAHFIEEEEHPCDEVIAPAASASASATSAQSSRGHSHNTPAAKKKKTTKARIAKQQQKKQEGKKFVPIQITDNTNRTNEVTAVLTANKLEINLPKKNLQNASREAVKRHNQKWNRVNALAKQSGARGTKTATLPDPRPWYNNSFYGGYESD
jgi:hypothetical protein